MVEAGRVVKGGIVEQVFTATMYDAMCNENCCGGGMAELEPSDPTDAIE